MLSPSVSHPEATVHSRSANHRSVPDRGELLLRVAQSALRRQPSRPGSRAVAGEAFVRSRTGRVRLLGQLDVPDDGDLPRGEFTTAPLPMTQHGNLSVNTVSTRWRRTRRTSRRRRGAPEIPRRKQGNAAVGSRLDWSLRPARDVHAVPPVAARSSGYPASVHGGWGTRGWVPPHRMTWRTTI